MKTACHEKGRGAGRYANYFRVGHNAYEFIVDFGQFYHEVETEKYHTRIITNPVYFKVLLATLQESLDEYEQVFGFIPKEES